MGSSASITCSVCFNSSDGRCDHCRQRFCSSHFRNHSCPGVHGYGRTTIRLKPECDSCSNDAVGTCDGCGRKVCNSCFLSNHKTQCGRTYYR